MLGWRAVDVRTGEVVWDKPAGKSGIETIAWGQIVNYNNYQEFGSNAFLYSSPGAGGAFSTGANWMGIYDAHTGNFLTNITNTISTSKLVDSKANEFYRYGGSNYRLLRFWWHSAHVQLHQIDKYLRRIHSHNRYL